MVEGNDAGFARSSCPSISYSSRIIRRISGVHRRSIIVTNSTEFMTTILPGGSHLLLLRISRIVGRVDVLELDRALTVEHDRRLSSRVREVIHAGRHQR